jgi:hypothetical protein
LRQKAVALGWPEDRIIEHRAGDLKKSVVRLRVALRAFAACEAAERKAA